MPQLPVQWNGRSRAAARAVTEEGAADDEPAAHRRACSIFGLLTAGITRRQCWQILAPT